MRRQLVKESLLILHSIDIGEVRRLKIKQADELAALLRIHKIEVENRCKDVKALENYIPVLRQFSDRVNAIVSGESLSIPTLPNLNSGFRHLTSDDIAGARVVHTQPGKERHNISSPKRIKGWSAQNALFEKSQKK